MRRRLRGSLIALFAIGFVASLAIVGLAIDGGRLYAAQRQAQIAADAGALAAAQNLCSSVGTAQSAANRLAQSNGVQPSDITVTTPVDSDASRVRVNTALRSDFLFLRVLGFTSTKVAATATAIAGTHSSDTFSSSLYGKCRVTLTGKSMADRYDSRSGSYASQAGHVDTVTGRKYAAKGADIQSDCLVQLKGRNLVTGSLFAADIGCSCATQQANAQNRMAGRKARSDKELDDYDDHTNGHTETHGSSGSTEHAAGSGSGGGSAYSGIDSHDDLEADGHQTHAEADEDGRAATRIANRCAQPAGKEHQADDDAGELKEIADQMHSEGKDSRDRSAKMSLKEAADEADHGARLQADADDIEDAAEEMKGESVHVLETPRISVEHAGHAETDAHDLHDHEAPLPGVKEPRVAHCGIIEIKGSKNHGMGDAKANGPIIQSGSPVIDGITDPYSSVAGRVLPAVDMASVRAHNDNALLGPLQQWEPSKLQFRTLGTGEVVLPAGTFFMETFEVMGHTTVRISGATKIYVSRLFRVTGHGSVNTDRVPSDLQIILARDGSSVNAEPEFQVRGNSTLSGVVFNRDGDIEIKGASEIFGLLVTGATMEIKGSSSVHVDSGAAAALGSCPGSGRLIQ